MSYPPAAAAPGMMSAYHPYAYANGALTSQQQHYLSQPAHNGPVVNETVHLYVPSMVIGAIIGAKGLFIKSIIKNSSASVKVIISLGQSCEAKRFLVLDHSGQCR
jgi:hypothetical protein